MLLPSIAIVAGLALLGFFVSKGLTKIANQEQYVTVKGLAEREVMANRVVWALPYKCVSNASPTPPFKSIHSSVLSFLYSSPIYSLYRRKTLMSIKLVHIK